MSKLIEAYRLAVKEIGTKEWPGPRHNPRVLAYFQDAGHSWVDDDETAWCAAFMGAMLRRAGLPSSGELTARSYLKWGQPTVTPREGDLAIFWRGDPDGWQGHVGFFVRDNGSTIAATRPLGGTRRARGPRGSWSPGRRWHPPRRKPGGRGRHRSRPWPRTRR